jgi:DNA-binding CsgD family transcriptional regulator
VGVEGACANSSPDGQKIHLDGWGLDTTLLQHNQLDYMEEFSPDELRSVAGQRFTVSDDAVTPRRQASLRLFAEYLVPMNVHRYCMRLWINRHGAFWYVFFREGRSRWRPQDLSLLDSIVPLLSIAEAMHTVNEGASVDRAESQRLLLHEHRITRAECEVAQLVERGLTNREIATILDRSVHTVGNQLAACCRKLQVSSRTELGYVLSNAERVILAQSPGARLSRILSSVRELRSF